MNRIALALTIAAISTGAPAQSNKKTTWDDLLKPVEVKTDPRIPVAPPVAVPPSASQSQTSQPRPSQSQTSQPGALDGCVIEAIGRLPKIDGLRVTKTSHEYLESNHIAGQRTELYDVFISVDLSGRQTSYGWRCLVYANGSSTLHRR